MCRAIIVLTVICVIVSGNTQWRSSWSSSSTRRNPGRPVNQTYYSNYYANNYGSYPVNYPTYGYGYNTYGANYATYPLNNQVYGSYRAPCQSSCGSIQPIQPCRSSCGSVPPVQPCRSSCGGSQPIYTSYCRNLPCGIQQQQLQQPSYYPYPYYGGGYGNNRIIFSPNNNNYQSQRTISALPSDPYANVAVEIIDEDNMQNAGNPAPARRNAVQDKYADVPTEIVDVGPLEFWRNIPKLPKVITSSNSTYTVSQGNVSNESVQQSKPVQATITRSFQPLRPNQEFRLDFLNGEAVNTSDDDTEKETNDPTTTVVTTTEEENEEVSALNNWLL